MEFLHKTDEFKRKGYSLTNANTDKKVVFDGKNTIECQANLYVTLEKGTATYTIVCTI
jgi:hypothetical protein